MVLFESKRNKITVFINEEYMKVIELTGDGLHIILDDGEHRMYKGITHDEMEDGDESADHAFTGIKETLN